jgi:biopolymer transport protein ExbD
MKFRKHRSTTGETKVEIQMTPMLDMIFQLLIFFILTFKPVTDEGQFGVEMSSLPGGRAALPSSVPGMGDASAADIPFVPPILVRLGAGPDGRLPGGGVVLGERTIPSIEHLLSELRSTVRGSPDDYEVVIEADPRLQFQFVVEAVNAISHAGIKRINFAPSRLGG